MFFLTPGQVDLGYKQQNMFDLKVLTFNFKEKARNVLVLFLQMFLFSFSYFVFFGNHINFRFGLICTKQQQQKRLDKTVV